MDGVIVGHDGDRPAVCQTVSHHDTVGRARHVLAHRLGHPAVFDEAAGVEKRGDALSRRELAAVVPLGGRLGPRPVQRPCRTRQTACSDSRAGAARAEEDRFLRSVMRRRLR